MSTSPLVSIGNPILAALQAQEQRKAQLAALTVAAQQRQQAQSNFDTTQQGLNSRSQAEIDAANGRNTATISAENGRNTATIGAENDRQSASLDQSARLAAIARAQTEKDNADKIYQHLSERYNALGTLRKEDQPIAAQLINRDFQNMQMDKYGYAPFPVPGEKNGTQPAEAQGPHAPGTPAPTYQQTTVNPYLPSTMDDQLKQQTGQATLANTQATTAGTLLKNKGIPDEQAAALAAHMAAINHTNTETQYIPKDFQQKGDIAAQQHQDRVLGINTTANTSAAAQAAITARLNATKAKDPYALTAADTDRLAKEKPSNSITIDSLEKSFATSTDPLVRGSLRTQIDGLKNRNTQIDREITTGRRDGAPAFVPPVVIGDGNHAIPATKGFAKIATAPSAPPLPTSNTVPHHSQTQARTNTGQFKMPPQLNVKNGQKVKYSGGTLTIKG